MQDHGITEIELANRIVQRSGGDRKFIYDHVHHFVEGGQGSMAIHATIIEMSVETDQSTKH